MRWYSRFWHVRSVFTLLGCLLATMLVVGGLLMTAGASSQARSAPTAGDISTSSDAPTTTVTQGPESGDATTPDVSEATKHQDLSTDSSTTTSTDAEPSAPGSSAESTTPTTQSPPPAADEIIIVCETTTVSQNGIETSSSVAYRAPVGTPIPLGCRKG